MEEEEEKKGGEVQHEMSEENCGSCEITSNFAYDRFLMLGAYGYENGIVKLVKDVNHES